MTRITRGGNVAVYKVSNSDSTLTISPNTGAVIASVNTSHDMNWQTGQTFQNINAGADNTYSVGSAASRFAA